MIKKNLLLTVFVFFATAVASAQVLNTVDERSLKGKIDSKRTSPIVVSVREDGKLIYDEKTVSLVELQTKLDAEMDYRMPGERKVFVDVYDETGFSVIRDILLIGRKIDVDDFGFVAAGSLGVGAALETKIVLEEPEPTPPKLHSLVLQINVDKNAKITLNKKPVSEDSLTAALKATFMTRKHRKVYRQGSREVEKTVYLRMNPVVQYGVMLKVLTAINSSGAYPIGIELDWLDK